MQKKTRSPKDWLQQLPARFGQWALSLVRPTAQQKKKRRRTLRRVVQVGLTGVLVCVISLCIVGSVLVVYVLNNFNADSYIPVLGEMSMDNRSVIYVENEKGDFEPYHNLLGGNSVWTDLEKIPVNLQNAVVAIEDERFWDHEGVDWKRTISAFVNLALNRVLHLGSTEFGGSSITQQLIKVTTQKDEHSIERKINEILAAMELERSEYTKHQVLEGYLNNLPLTGDLVGVGIGARYYFGKEVEDLSLAECAVLASITNNPSVYDPYGHPENVRQRQRIVLAKMYELGFITHDEYLNALNEELVFKSSATHQQIQDYYVDLVVEDVIEDLMETYGYTYQYAENMVYYGGLNIYSAEDPTVQKRVEAIYADEKNYPAKRVKDKEDPQTAFFAVDYSGRVIATVGGRGEKTANRVLNRSTQSMRSPGSSMKPLTAYGPSVALDLVHYSSMVRDAPITLTNGTKWPHNYNMKTTPDNGNVLLGVALQKSLNTVAARLVQQLTPQRSYDYAERTFGLSTLVESKGINGSLFTDKDLSPMALGALTDGVTARDMAAAYAVFGSGGYYNEPYTYYKVTKGVDDNETTLLSKGEKSVMVLDPQSSYVMVKLMQRVTTYGTAASIAGSWKGWEVFGKTGTSESNKDVYFAGGTPYYAAASWFGYDDNTIMIGTQTGHALKLWNLAMKSIHQNLQIKKFDRPSGVETLEYCTATGMLATEGCKNTDKGVYKCKKDETGAIVGGFVPEYCTAHGGGGAVTTTTGTGESSTSSSGGDTTSSVSGSSTSQTETSTTGGETTTTAATPGGDTGEETP